MEEYDMSMNYKTKVKPKYILLILSILMLSLLSACKSHQSKPPLDENQTTVTPSTAPSDDNGADEKNADETTDINGNDDFDIDSNDETDTNNPTDTEAPNIKDFSAMDKYFIDYTFEVSNDDSEELYLQTYNVSGEYDLDGDGKAEKITAFLPPNYEDAGYIEINGLKSPLNLSTPTGEARIIDLDSRDNFVEVGIFDDGPSGDPVFWFFRYDGKKIYSLGDIFRYSVLDGRGKIVSWFHLTNYFKPQFFSAWGEYIDNQYVQSYHDVEQYIGKTFELNGEAFFIPLEEKQENYIPYTMWDAENMRDFKETQIKILDIQIDDKNYPLLNWFYVELPDGEEGFLYFWIGD